MPTLGVCTDSVLETSGPLALLDLLETSQRDNRLSGGKEDYRKRNLKRRSHKRADFSFRLLISPLDSNGVDNTLSSASNEIYVTGKDISDVGLGFFHDKPFPFRHAQIMAADDRLDEIGLGDMRLALTIRWCRFIGHGRYESGCRVAWPS